MNMKFTLKTACFSILAFATYLSGYAQSNTGWIRGTVKIGNKPVENIPVILRDENGDSIKMVKSEINGSYEFANLPVGMYSIYVAPSRTAYGGHGDFELEPFSLTTQGQTQHITLLLQVLVDLPKVQPHRQDKPKAVPLRKLRNKMFRQVFEVLPISQVCRVVLTAVQTDCLPGVREQTETQPI